MVLSREVRQRDVYPLPAFTIDSRRDCVHGRHARARANRGRGWRLWANAGIVALNEMYGCVLSAPVLSAADGCNASQRGALDRMADTYRDLCCETAAGANSGDVPTGDAALAELLAHANGYAGTASRVAPLRLRQSCVARYRFSAGCLAVACVRCGAD